MITFLSLLTRSRAFAVSRRPGSSPALSNDRRVEFPTIGIISHRHRNRKAAFRCKPGSFPGPAFTDYRHTPLDSAREPLGISPGHHPDQPPGIPPNDSGQAIRRSALRLALTSPREIALRLMSDKRSTVVQLPGGRQVRRARQGPRARIDAFVRPPGSPTAGTASGSPCHVRDGHAYRHHELRLEYTGSMQPAFVVSREARTAASGQAAPG
jgi:hypothetical protein